MLIPFIQHNLKTEDFKIESHLLADVGGKHKIHIYLVFHIEGFYLGKAWRYYRNNDRRWKPVLPSPPPYAIEQITLCPSFADPGRAIAFLLSDYYPMYEWLGTEKAIEALCYAADTRCFNHQNKREINLHTP